MGKGKEGLDPNSPMCSENLRLALRTCEKLRFQVVREKHRRSSYNNHTVMNKDRLGTEVTQGLRNSGEMEILEGLQRA